MLDKTQVAAFFDRLAPSWDENCRHDGGKIARILDTAGITAGVSVLDVACGTGVLFPFYLERNVHRVTGVDISAEMIAQAQRKHTDERIALICADIEALAFETPFDRCVVYSAFPHFGSPALLIARLADALSPGGRLTVAHSESIAEINRRHTGHAGAVSVGLMPTDELAALMTPAFDVDAALADEHIYIVSGIKR